MRCRAILLLLTFALVGVASLPARADMLDELNEKVGQLYDAKKYPEALLAAERYAELARKSDGEESDHYAIAIDWLGSIHTAERRFDQAEAAFKRSISIQEKLSGGDDVGVTESLIRLADLYSDQRRPADAEPLLLRVLKIREAALGPDHEDTDVAVDRLADAYADQHREAEAQALYKRSLAFVEKKFGPKDSAVADTLLKLADSYTASARYEDAEHLYTRSLAIRSKSSAKDDAAIAEVLLKVGKLYRETGRYSEAEDALERSLALRKKVLPAGHRDIAVSLGEIGLLFDLMGRLQEAEEQYKRLITMGEKEGADTDLATDYNNLALVYYRQARYSEAEVLFKRAVAMIEQERGPDDPTLASMLGNLASLYGHRGSYEQSDALGARTLAIRERVYGPDHPKVAITLNNLASNFLNQRRFNEAAPLFERALRINEKALGPDHPTVASSLDNLALVYKEIGRSSEAEPFFRRALAIHEKALGKSHPELVYALNNLAFLLMRSGRIAEAEPLFMRALKIISDVHGQEHPSVAVLFDNIGQLYMTKSDWVKAKEYLQKSAAIVIKRSARRAAETSLSTTGDREAELTYSMFGRLVKASFRLPGASGEPSDETAHEAFETSQWAQGSKAATAVAQMSVRSVHGEGPLAKLVRQRQDLVSEWQAKETRLISSRSVPPEQRKSEVEKALADRLAAIDKALVQIDSRLAKEFPDYATLAQPVPSTVTEVQALLHDGEALVLLLDTKDSKPVPEETFIWVVTKSDMRWVKSELGTDALALEVAALRCGLDLLSDGTEKGEKCDRSASRPDAPAPFDTTRAHALYKALFAGVQDLIEGKELFVVASGALQQLPLQVLVTDASGVGSKTAWLARKHAITVLPSVASLKALRDRKYAGAGERKPYLAFANPVLSGNGKSDDKAAASLAALMTDCATVAKLRVVSPLSDNFMGVGDGQARAQDGVDVEMLRRLKPVPQTADLVCDVAKDVGADEADVFLAKNATESRIKALDASGALASYSVVNFATHGVVGGELNATAEPGLVLTPPAKGSDADDGYLSASEVAALKLNADWVILSACNTAAGGAANAEALSGLARAFFYAGAHALLVSHWRVRERAAVELVTSALDAIAKDHKLSRAEAMRRSMLKLADSSDPLVAHPSYWAPFALVGEGAAAD